MTIREEVIANIEYWTTVIDMSKVKKVLEVGIGGDPKPGGNFYLFREKKYETMDVDERYEPTYVDDIQNPTKAPKNAYDVVILSQVIEHTESPQQAIWGAYKLLKKGGWLIVDCPWNFIYHPDDDFGDFWRISATMMDKLLDDFSWKETRQSDQLTTCLARK